MPGIPPLWLHSLRLIDSGLVELHASSLHGLLQRGSWACVRVHCLYPLQPIASGLQLPCSLLELHASSLHGLLQRGSWACVRLHCLYPLQPIASGLQLPCSLLELLIDQLQKRIILVTSMAFNLTSYCYKFRERLICAHTYGHKICHLQEVLHLVGQPLNAVADLRLCVFLVRHLLYGEVQRRCAIHSQFAPWRSLLQVLKRRQGVRALEFNLPGGYKSVSLPHFVAP